MTIEEEIPLDWKVKCTRCGEYFNYQYYKSETCSDCDDEINYEKKEKESK